jgi:cation diffusion facilitator family transporter
LHDQQTASPGWVAFFAACASIAGKEWLYQWNVRVGRRIKSSALLANAWHHRSDALSSVPVAVGVLGARIWPAWGFLDLVATVIVSVLILYAAWEISAPAFRHLVDAGASRKERDRILDIALGTDGVSSIHALRTRYVGPGLQVDLHVLVDGNLSVRGGHDIASAVKRRLIEGGPDIVDVLVHIEPHDS